MSGHSKWSTIKRQKGEKDKNRAKVFTKISRLISVAAKEGGVDPENNPRLKEAILKAKYYNVPNDNINKLLKKISGNENSENFQAITYEGYGPEGVAIMVETLTDNKNRTAGDMRHYFDKFGGKLGQSGSVSFLFKKTGIITIKKIEAINEEILTENAINAGASDINSEEEFFEILTNPDELLEVRKFLEKKEYNINESEITFLPNIMVAIKDSDSISKMNKLIEMLEENDDVQEVYTNWDF